MIEKKYKLEISLPLNEQVADILRHQILSGEFKKGQKISERQISSQLNVSTAPVKNAIRTLNIEGLLQSIPHKGTFVSDISHSNLLQQIHLRSVIEGTAAYWGTKNITNDDLDLMEAKLDIFRKYTDMFDSNEGNGFSQLRKENYSFHKILSLSANNTYLNQLIANMDSINNTIRDLYYDVSSHEEIIVSYVDHERIFLAAKAKNCEEAEQATIDHIKRVANSLKKGLFENEQ